LEQRQPCQVRVWACEWRLEESDRPGYSCRRCSPALSFPSSYPSLLFPHLSRRSGRLISQYVSVVDVKHFGPQHFGRHALQFMRSLGDVHDENYSDLVKSLYIINAPFFFHKVFHLISCMMSQELKDRLKVLNKRESLRELSQILPPDLARRIVEGDPAGEREGERELHAFLDRAARAGLHRRRWV